MSIKKMHKNFIKKIIYEINTLSKFQYFDLESENEAFNKMTVVEKYTQSIAEREKELINYLNKHSELGEFSRYSIRKCFEIACTLNDEALDLLYPIESILKVKK